MAIKFYFVIFSFICTAIAYGQPINYHLRGNEHPKTKVKFNRRGYPVFESYFNCRLPFHLIHDSDANQFRYCTNKLREYLKRNPEYKKFFTKNQLREINSKKPNIAKFTWHHHQAKSQRLLQLVDREIHNKTAHSGGRAVFGGGKAGRAGKLSSVFTASTIYENPSVSSWTDYEKVAKSINKKAIVVPAVLTKDSKLIMSIKSGIYSGLAIVNIESGLAYYDFIKGNIYRREFNQKVLEATIKGSAVAGSETLAMFLLPVPQGWILLGAGAGVYIVVNNAIETYKSYANKHYLNADDLAVYGIKVDSVLDIDDNNIPMNVEQW